MRERLLADVRARLEQFAISWDPAVVLDAGAVREVAALLEATPDLGADLDVALAAGYLHWFRFLAASRAEPDLAAALRLLEPVYRVRPEVIPDMARDYLESGGPVLACDLRVRAERADGQLQAVVRTNDGAALDRSIGQLRQALDAAPFRHPDRAGMLSALCVALRVRFERTGVLADLDAAVTTGRQAADAAAAYHPSRGPILANLAAALHRRFGHTGVFADLDAAIAAGEQAVEVIPAGYPGRAVMLSNLGNALRARFEQTGVVADLDEAITAGRKAVELAPAGHLDRADTLTNLGATLARRFEQTGEVADLDEAITAGRQAVELTPAGHPHRAGMLSDLGGVLVSRSGRTGALADLDEAITLGREAVAAVPAGHHGRAVLLSRLGDSLLGRFRRTGTRVDLDEAITTVRQALDDVPPGNPGRVVVALPVLSSALVARFEWAGALADLDEAITTVRQALDAVPPGHPDRVLMLHGLGNALQVRFKRTGTPGDLDEAITITRKAVDATPAGHPARAGMLSDLAGALRARFERTGELAELDAAITAAREAVDAAPAGRAVVLANLSGVLHARFERTGELAELDAAITAGREAVDATPADHADLAVRLSNLGLALRVRFEWAGVQADLDEAITAARTAVSAIPADHPERAALLANLSTALHARFQQTGALAELDEAITAARTAVSAVPADHPDRAVWLSNLGGTLQARYQRTRAPGDLDEAIRTGRQAASAAPAGHPDRAGMLSNLGLALALRFQGSGVLADLDAAISACRDAATAEAAAPRLRVIAAIRWGQAAGVSERWPEAVAGFTAAAELLGLVAPRSLARTDQEHLLADLGGLASQAAACCVQAGRADRAVELFEQGRGILLGQALDTRTDLTELAAQHPDLARQFTALRDRLDRADDRWHLAAPATGTTGRRSDAAGQEAERRRETAHAFDRLITDIRAKPGFSSFLRLLPVRDLVAAASDGPVIIVNASRFGSHALILTKDGVLEPVPLPGVTPERIELEVAGLLTAPDDPSAAPDQQRLTTTLGWLFDAIAEPVLHRIGLTRTPPPSGQWPRLWWCLPGLLSFLPLHAAGHHDTRTDPIPRTVADRVVSSYTPTIRVLLHARRSQPAGHRSQVGHDVLVVAMPATPGEPALPGAGSEADLLRTRFPGQTRTLIGSGATRATVTAALPAARWAHFACHATTDLADPSASRLLLHDHQQQPLTVADVARLRLEHADLAFLSACSTARPGTWLTDEAIHLASAFQLAGFRHVIGTLWPVSDRIAADTATAIYTALTSARDTDTTATALHAVTRQLRDRRPHAPAAWASHIHNGP
jgi:tetratricopeptide (TPR) repeat protein